MMRAGVVGDPIAHSLSPLIHGAWIEAADLDAIYERFHVAAADFRPWVATMLGDRGCRGLNVTIPHKHDALAVADTADAAARDSGAANLLLFLADGRIEARNTDGIGLLAAFAEQAPDVDLKSAPSVLLGAGGAARGAVAALIAAGAPEVRIVNRTVGRAVELAAAFPRTVAVPMGDVAVAFKGAGAVINATSTGLNGAAELDWPLHALPAAAAVMDMVYKPLRTGLLKAAEARGLTTVDGLAMLIGQARPSFEAFYGVAPPSGADVRRLCLEAIGA